MTGAGAGARPTATDGPGARRWSGRRTAAAVAAAVLLVPLALGVARTRGTEAGEAGTAEARVAWLEREVLDRSIAFLEPRIAGDPYNTVLGSALASRLFARFQATARLEDLARAEEIAGRLAAIPSDTAASHARLSAMRLARHDFAGALEAARTALRADPADEDALAVLYDAAIAAGEYAEAERALAALPAAGFARAVRQARWQAARGEMEEAARGMRGACGRLERRAARAAVRAWCLAAVGDLEHGRAGAEAARPWFEAALRLDPESRAAREWLADRAYAAGAWEEAGRLYRGLTSPAHPDLHLRLAEVARARGERGEAERHEREFLRLVRDPAGEALAAYALAIHLADRVAAAAGGGQGEAEGGADRDRALAVMERDLAARRSIESWEAMAWVRFRRGELDEALAASDSARRWGQPSPTSDWHRARILEGMGRAREAAALGRRALADPTLLDHHALRDLRLREGGGW